MPKGSLPGFVWDVKNQVYRRVSASGVIGEVVSRETIVKVLDQLAARSERMLGDLVMALADDKITERDAYLAGRLLLKDLYNANSALARGGWSQMGAVAWGRNGRLLRDEYRFWQGFVEQVAAGALAEKEIRARAKLYSGRAYSRFWAEDRLLRMLAGDDLWEEWIDRDDAVECGDCRDLASLGRVPLGTLATVPGAGDTACLGNCRCIILYS